MTRLHDPSDYVAVAVAGIGLVLIGFVVAFIDPLQPLGVLLPIGLTLIAGASYWLRRKGAR